MTLSLLLPRLTDQVLKEHIESLPAKRKKAHWRASRHALCLKSKRHMSGAVQSQSSGGGIQAAAAGGVQWGDGNTAVGAMTGPAAAAGLSRASVSSTRTLRSFDMNSTEDSGMSIVLMYMYGCCNTRLYIPGIYNAIVILQCLRVQKGKAKVLLFLESILH